MAKKDNYIYYNGEKLLLSEWTTMYKKSREDGFGEAYYRQKIHRMKNDVKVEEPIEYREIQELNLILVKK